MARSACDRGGTPLKAGDHLQAALRPRKKRVGRYQFKIALSYLAIIAVVLALLNTYPVIVTQSFVFQSKQSAMNARVSLITTTLSSFDELSADSVVRVMSLLGDPAGTRVVVTASDGLVLYDNSVTENAVGKIALLPDIRSALSGLDVFYSRATDAAFESSAAMPVLSRGRVIGAAYLYEYDADQAAMLGDLRSNMANFSIIITAVVVAMSVFLTAALTRRLSVLVHAISLVREGKFSHRADVRGRDELAHVTAQFNELTERLEKTEDLRRRFVSDASHELKTPLASVRLLTDSILQTDDMDADTVREFVTDIGQEIDRLTRMTEKLMSLTRMESALPPRSQPVVLDKLIRRAEHMLKPLAEHAGVTLSAELSENCIILAQEDDIYQVLYNLMENGIKYNHPNGFVRMLLYTKGGFVTLHVDDSGQGIPREELPRIFDRFYRVDKARTRDTGGAGLGLSIVWHTLQMYSATVEVESELGQGTRFTVTFPHFQEAKE